MIDLIQFGMALMVHQAIRGACEAMTMHWEGVRKHRWFRWYHRLRIAELAALALVVYAASRLIWSWGAASFIIGIAVAGWEMFELAYARGRNKTWIATYENVFGGGWYSVGKKQVVMVHAARIVLAAAFTIGGMV